MKANEIRSKFLEFFESKKHQIVPSAPMVIKDDPTLMFTNAGMNQFKEYFLGNATPKSARVTDTQKCLRVSGKHNDLEEVGKDTYHHTMFEMLGNWSFGDYFKKEAIAWAWELLTEVFKVNPEILYVTIFEGDEEDGIGKDEEAYGFWKEIVPEERILLGNKKDNFWEMGDQGPCGPASEIHIDIRSEEEKAKISGKELVNQDHPQVVEIWNLVFIQFNRKADGSLVELPNKHIDTGMGFERLCMVLQDVKSNYDTDVFTPLIREIQTITNSTYGKSEETDIAIRVIADHVRAVAFAIADGQLPSNNGAGYVIRRILRRAIRYGFTFLNKKEPFIYKFVATLSQQMGTAFPELKKQKNLCENVIKEEENSFLKTLDQGLVLLDQIIEAAKEKNLPADRQVSGKKAFELYDTFGFPIDLTALILNERGFKLNETEFEEELQKQKDRSRSAAQTKAEDWQILREDDEEEFIGYDSLEGEVKITRYRKVESKKDGTLYQLVFNLTPFYPEGGGQVGDKGYLESTNGNVTYIVDTKKENNLIIHIVKNLPDHLEGSFKAVVDAKQRSRSAANHSATHLLHQALRSILGTHVEQKGSMVHSSYLRFDFSHFSKVSSEELKQVEDFVNARIRENLPLQENRRIPYAEAIEQGAIALFGEKYGDAVRTIRFGDSMELCGGTHVPNTAEIWHFKIISEGAVASGVRRIEAITGDAAKDFLTQQSENFNQIKALFKNVKDPVKAVNDLQEENSVLKKEIENLLKEKAKNVKGDLKNELTEINGVQFLAKQVDLDGGALKDLSFQLGGEVDNLFLLLGSANNGKAILSCYISKDLVEEKSLNAGQIVRELGKYIQGGGGGQAFFATAGGKNPDGIAKALEEGKNYIS
ncbi:MULTISPECIES: alanine--tRNA ligase [Mesonia]|uniref:Alanine--tRNA ligase n=1 Tax=Mesonia oceanica TaxID=2687242 RepID=A0AC61YD22_9FLAO|nr:MULTISPECIES: alanine--tRNA ligase [Mesonia]MAN26423.1 alanine--tRNA ligase [Mesonia sp.]MAQ39563.1 alanine--tRNA ligase [Mesonia sp.]MBJ99152.1 alanine--tRNA ligase [Flavobacteriaceae bacterium]VVV02416.1 Alanine--tRNA ligase [Mesonia oceanica]|tara:strand:- start:1986 stop:4616 length:2631 start_codon:yes stop_codon:yes gene_type:complete